MRKPSACLAVLCAAAWLTGCSEYLPFAAGTLDGERASQPFDFPAMGAPDVIQLETNPTDPYSINLWVIGAPNHAYVHAGANRATWVEHIEADPSVRLKSGSAVYELHAERVISRAEFASFSDAYEAKYGNPPRNENVQEAYLFRLTARAP